MSSDNPHEVPITIGGQEAFIDFSRPTMAHYRFTDESEFADACLEQCDPEGLREHIGHQSAAEFCMMNAMQGGKGGEYIIDITAHCDGPKRKLLRGKLCGVRFTRSVVELPFDETHPEHSTDE